MMELLIRRHLCAFFTDYDCARRPGNTGGGFKPGSSAMLPRSANLSCRNLSLPWQGGWHDSKGGTCEAKRLTRAKT